MTQRIRCTFKGKKPSCVQWAARAFEAPDCEASSSRGHGAPVLLTRAYCWKGCTGWLLKYASHVPASSALSSVSYIVSYIMSVTFENENEKWGTEKKMRMSSAFPQNGIICHTPDLMHRFLSSNTPTAAELNVQMWTQALLCTIPDVRTRVCKHAFHQIKAARLNGTWCACTSWILHSITFKEASHIHATR